MMNKSVYQDAPSYYHQYFDLIATDNLLGELWKSQHATQMLFATIPPEKGDYAYAPEKWTLNEVIRHVIDCERVFAYRALRLSRFDATPLPGFDEDAYMAALKPHTVHNLPDLRQEYQAVRDSTLALFAAMNDVMLDFKGTCNQQACTTRAVGFMIVGHNIHHCSVIATRYLREVQ